MDCKLACCPYGKPLRSNAAVVTSWPVLAVRKSFLKWQYHFPWSIIYFRFLFNTFTASLCLRYLDIIELQEPPKSIVKNKATSCVLLTPVVDTEKPTHFKPSPVVLFPNHLRTTITFQCSVVPPRVSLQLAFFLIQFNNESLQSVSFTSAALLKWLQYAENDFHSVSSPHTYQGRLRTSVCKDIKKI